MPGLWLSRSWTTRSRRDGEDAAAYVWVTRSEFLARVQAGGFLEWAEYLGNFYGTPLPEAPQGSDLLLEIDIQGARKVVEKFPAAIVVLLLPPSIEVQRQRLVDRGDSSEHVQNRIAKGREEVVEGRKLARFEVVNADLDRALQELTAIVLNTRGKDSDGS